MPANSELGMSGCVQMQPPETSPTRIRTRTHIPVASGTGRAITRLRMQEPREQGTRA